VIWSVTSFVFEVPSGAWADTVDRRLLLVLSALVYAAGFATWMLFPSYLGFAAGFVLWGLSSAMMSGTFESLLYTALVARDAEAHYPRIVGWAHSAAMTANLVATVSAAPLVALGGFGLVGWASAAIALVQAVLAATLPASSNRHTDVAQVASATEEAELRYVAMLRSGLEEAATAVDVRHALLVAGLVVGFSAFDEYFPLLARAHGVDVAVVPWLVGLAVLGQVIGTALAGRTAGMSAKAMAATVAGAAVLLSCGALLHPMVGFVAIAVGYGLLNNAMVVSGARLQQVIRGRARATVTSVLGLGEEVVALTVYGLVAGGTQVVSVPVVVALLGLPLLVVAVLIRRLLPVVAVGG
jgi:MFS family permease